MVNRPACKNEYKREEEKKEERHFVKVHRDWNEKPPPSNQQQRRSVGYAGIVTDNREPEYEKQLLDKGTMLLCLSETLKLFCLLISLTKLV